MPNLKYYLRVLSGMSFEKFSEVLERTHKFSGKNKLWLTLDMIHCARKFGAGYYDYLTFGFWDLSSKITQFEECFVKYPNKDTTGGAVFSFVFARKPTDLNDLEENTSLQRTLKAHLLAGNRFLDAKGILK